MLNAKSKMSLNNSDLVQKFNVLSLEHKIEVEEEFPKLRKPKPATLLKTQTDPRIKEEMRLKLPIDRNSEMNMDTTIEYNSDINILNVPLRQEFLKIKEDMEKANTKFLKNYKLPKFQSYFQYEELHSQDADEPQPITIYSNFDFNINEKETVQQSHNINTPKLTENLSLTYNEYHLVNILHTKIMAHANGLFASNIPTWYQTTFDKILPTNWLDILKKSKRFSVEKIDSKIILYAIGEIQKNDIDTNASEDIDFEYHHQDKEIQNPINVTDKKEASTGFVRYKHLEKSLKQYINTAGRDNTEKTKYTSDKLNKPNSSKSNVRYKHLQGPWSTK